MSLRAKDARVICLTRSRITSGQRTMACTQCDIISTSRDSQFVISEKKWELSRLVPWYPSVKEDFTLYKLGLAFKLTLKSKFWVAVHVNRGIEFLVRKSQHFQMSIGCECPDSATGAMEKLPRFGLDVQENHKTSTGVTCRFPVHKCNVPAGETLHPPVQIKQPLTIESKLLI